LEKNVLGTDLQTCCFEPKTGFYRDGYCKTGSDDVGTHVVCAIMTQEFLEFSKSKGNDLITPIAYYQFPGLKPGDKWCLCVSRWKEAYESGKGYWFYPYKFKILYTHHSNSDWPPLLKILLRQHPNAMFCSENDRQ